MKKADVKVSGHYTAKVSDKLTTVRIDVENPRGGWDATNTVTKKKVRIKSAQRLRRAAKGATGGKGDVPAAEAPPAATRANVGREGASKARAKTAKKAQAGREKKPSLLDLAAEVLAKAKEPMDCKAIVEKVLASGRWQTKGKTPSATLYSAVIREVAKKGKAARFQKVGRGKFAHAGKGAWVMTRTKDRPPRLKNGTRVHVRSDHFAEECDAVIRKAKRDHGQGDVGWWLYRVEVTAGDTPQDAQHDDGTVWVWDFEVQPLE